MGYCIYSSVCHALPLIADIGVDWSYLRYCLKMVSLSSKRTSQIIPRLLYQILVWFIVLKSPQFHLYCNKMLKTALLFRGKRVKMLWYIDKITQTYHYMTVHWSSTVQYHYSRSLLYQINSILFRMSTSLFQEKQVSLELEKSHGILMVANYILK